MNMLPIRRLFNPEIRQEIKVNDINALRSFLSEKGKNENTLKAYAHDISLFYDYFIKRFQSSPVQATREEINSYVIYLESLYRKRKIGPATFNRRVDCIASFYGELFKSGVISFDIGARLPRKKSPQEVKTEYIEPEVVSDIMKSIDITTYVGKRDFALLGTYFLTGARQSAIAELRIGDIQKKKGVFELELREKGGVHNKVLLNELISESIALYLECKIEKEGELTIDHFLFTPTKNSKGGGLNKRISGRGINNIFKKYAKLAGHEDIRIHPHSARAHFITRLLEDGEDLYQVSKSVSHLNPKTTSKYDKKRSEKTNLSQKINLLL